MTTSRWEELSQFIDIHHDFYTFYNLDGKLHLFYRPTVAKLFTPKTTKNLLSGEVNTSLNSGVGEFKSLLESEELSFSKDHTKIFLCFYELGHFFEKTNLDITVDENLPLGVMLEYQSCVEMSDEIVEHIWNIDFESSSYEKYKEAFNIGHSHLLRGDCYQYNLTFPQKLKIKEFNLLRFISSWGDKGLRGEYANITSLGSDLYFSNSPECLFDLEVGTKDNYLHSKPIKGTVAVSTLEDCEEAWEVLKSSKKNESELYMITDLIRNDLNRIERPRVEVLALKERLDVPGLVHSYSHLRTKVSRSLNLLNILEKIFPGGSITGAPKKRVMEIIDQLECASRGFYCGSSIIKSKEYLRASINIRSGQISDFKKIEKVQMAEIPYWSGGGVTLDSNCTDEFQEIMDKTTSFVRFLS